MAAGWSLRNWVSAAPRRKKTPREQKSYNGSAACGAHAVVARVGGGIVCAKCRLYSTTSTSLKSLRHRPCLGDLASQCHPTHRVRFLDGITWCSRCGSYATKRPRALRERCIGHLSTEAKRNVVRRLSMGLLPTTAHYLHGVAREHDLSTPRGAGQPARPGAPEVAHYIDHPLPLHRRRCGMHDDRVDAVPNGDMMIVAGDIGTYSTEAAEAVSEDVQRDPGRAVTAPGSASGRVHPEVTDIPVSLLGRETDRHCATARAESAPPERPKTAKPEENWCRPRPEASWSRRVMLHTSVGRSGRSACHHCGAQAAGHCRGCTRPLCLQCARGRVECLAD